MVQFDKNLSCDGHGLLGQRSCWFCDLVFVIAMLPLAGLTQRHHDDSPRTTEGEGGGHPLKCVDGTRGGSTKVVKYYPTKEGEMKFQSTLTTIAPIPLVRKTACQTHCRVNDSWREL